MQNGAYFYHDPLRSSVEGILAQSGFKNLPPEEHAETVTALVVEVQRRIGRAIMELIDGHALGLFKELKARDATEEELRAFFSVHVPGYEKCVNETLDAFRQECHRSAKGIEGVRL